MKVETNCQVCSLPFLASKQELKRGNAKYCSKQCCIIGTLKTKAARGLIEKKPNVQCANCQTSFYMSSSKQKISKSGLYFCKRACKDAAQRIGGIKEIMPPHYGTGAGEHIDYRTIAFAVYPALCMSCGYDKYKSVLQVHHKDRDRTNNEPSNLEVLCPTCHAEHHYLECTGLYSKRKGAD